jgi:rRNA maturation endonuclease Nob1
MASSGLDVTDWKIATCPSCERITRFVLGTCDRCGHRVVSEAGGDDAD